MTKEYELSSSSSDKQMASASELPTTATLYLLSRGAHPLASPSSSSSSASLAFNIACSSSSSWWISSMMPSSTPSSSIINLGSSQSSESSSSSSSLDRSRDLLHSVVPLYVLCTTNLIFSLPSTNSPRF